ncbi:MCE family protein [Rhodococcus sp. IEGM 1381]|uniref:MCE family protein n=1 Tax=Rhodococcus sp. IEGM 1381 TaxID=3047085 RepID=UPI0024B8180D|nr:MCE family protein [Rhodococcus sp. IEGM 1381]MDI9896860.1 MCE family protein [Rhodococcus sp. IEGM 1381]
MTTRRPTTRRSLVSVSAALLILLTSGCGWQGLNSLSLPGTAGEGDGAYSVVIEMPDVSTIDRNSRVLVSDVTVGRVADIALDSGHAVVTVHLDQGVDLPANATAAVGQTSLLGSTHIELAAPTAEPPTGRLSDGDIITIDRAGAYPTTEQTLSSLSLVLNGGGLPQIGDIVDELDAALGGRPESVRTLIARLDSLLSGLVEQQADIERSIDNLDRFAADVAAQNTQLADAVTTLGPALTVLADRRVDLTTSLVSLGELGSTAEKIVDDTGGDLVAELQELRPVLKSLADSGTSLTDSFRYLLTYPFPIDTYQNAVRGDYANGEVTLDLRLDTLDNALFLGTPLEGALGSIAPNPAPTVPTTPDLLIPPAGNP